MNAISPSLHAPSARLGVARLTLTLCLTLPWLNGFTAGPSPNFWPLWGAAVLGVAVLVQWRQLDAACMAQAWLAAALLSSLMAVLQYFGWALAPWVNPTELGQSYANLRQRNQFASLTSMGLVGLLVLQALRARPESGARFGLAAGSASAALLLALGNASSSSRTGFLQWALILALLWGAWLLRGGRRSQRLTAALGLSLWAFACYALLLVGLPRLLAASHGAGVASMAERLMASSQDGRRLIWDNVLYLIAQKPWTGWGWGELDYAHFITVYPGARFSELLDNAHNLPLHLAVELGLPAVILASLLLAALVWRGQAWREQVPDRLLAWGVLAVIGVHSFLEYPLWYGPFHWAALLCAMVLWRQPAAAGPARGSYQVWLLAGLGWGVLAFIALDYARVSQLYMPAKERWASLQSSRGSVFFQTEVDFARVVTTEVTAQNAAEIHALALALLHYSPEPRVVEPLIASAIWLGQDEAAALYLGRYRAAFSGEAWTQLLERHPAWALRLPR